MFDFNNVLMMWEFEKLNLAKYTCGIRDMLKDIMDLLDGNFLPSMSIKSRANNTIATFPYHFFYPVPATLAICYEEI